MTSDRTLEVIVFEHKDGFRVAISNPPEGGTTYQEKIIGKIDHVAAWYNMRADGAPILFHCDIKYQDKFWEMYELL
jgi:hypothetical protein